MNKKIISIILVGVFFLISTMPPNASSNTAYNLTKQSPVSGRIYGYATYPKPDEGPAADIEVKLKGFGPDTIVAVTSSEGYYEFSDLKIGKIYFLWTDDAVFHIKRIVVCTNNRPEVQKDFTINPDFCDWRVFGTVTDILKRPLSEVKVELFERPDPSSEYHTETTTDSNGFFEFNKVPCQPFYFCTRFNKEGYKEKYFRYMLISYPFRMVKVDKTNREVELKVVLLKS